MAVLHGTDGRDQWEWHAEHEATDDTDQIFGYGGDDWIYADDGDDVLTGGYGADILLGGDGVDTANYDDSDVGVIVNLAITPYGDGRGSGGTAEGDFLSEIENLNGSPYDDTFFGSGGSNTLAGHGGNDLLVGSGGADILDGAAGSDGVAYYGSTQGVFVSLYTHNASYGDADGDQLIGIENLIGSYHDDDLWGDDGANRLTGLSGNDSLKGFGGNDILSGGDGNDSLYGMDRGDTLRGEDGDDFMD